MQDSLRINATLIDWLTLATFDIPQSINVRKQVSSSKWGRGSKKHRWLQYRGKAFDSGLRWGTATQANRQHFVMQISGQRADEFLAWFISLPASETSTFYATRVDFQRTQKRPEWDDRPMFFKRIGNPKRLILDTTGTTLYIGARTSDSFWRIYDKTPEYLRAEVELKGKQAKRAFQALRLGESRSSLFNRYLHNSRVPKRYADYYYVSGEDQAELPALQGENDLIAKLAWLSRLDSLIYRLANDHDTSEKLGDLLDRWTEYVQNIDRQPDERVE